MAHGRVKPAGWGVNDKLTSAQINQIDINVSESLDKTAAGDTIAGTVATTGAGRIEAAAAAAIRSTAAGGIRHDGGANDWVTFSANRTRTLMSPLTPVFESANMTTNYHLQASAVTGSFGTWLRPEHDGGVITAVILWFRIQTGHAAVPAVKPTLRIALYDLTLSTGAVGNLAVTGTQTISPAVAVGPYENGGAVQSYTYTCTQNNAIDRSKHRFGLFVVDENGANSQIGNEYFGAQVVIGSIASMRFP